MEVSLLEMAINAAVIMSDPMRLGFLALGVVIGLGLGVIPGLGGLIGLSLLLPFTYQLDPFAAIAMLVGVGSVTTTSDTIPAVLFGVPGTVGSAATILDGHPLARRGEAGRAFGAAFSASLAGGLFGALLLGFSVPVLRPVMLSIGTPELLAFCLFGLSLVAVLSGGTPLKGLAAASVGLLLAMVGEDSQDGEYRWTFDSLYLSDGLEIVPLALGLFALPELADLAIRRRTISGDISVNARRGQWQGVVDSWRHWWLVLRCSGIGSLLGSVPGIGAAVIDWIAYGHAARTCKGADQSFGTGDIRGVIASESSNNAKEGGALVPTIAFGVPGSASMALLLGAFAAHGIIPGPDMLSKHLDITYSMVWSVALANILATGICFLFAGQLAKLALVRAGILVPVVLAVTFIGAFQGSHSWEDLYLLLGAGAVGFTMKRLGWPRPPLILGFVLGALVERYMFISVQRYGLEWLTHPVVAVVLLFALYGLLAPTLRKLWRRRQGQRTRLRIGLRRDLRPADLAFTAGCLALFGTALGMALDWTSGARLVPVVVCSIGAGASALLLVGQLWLRWDDDGSTVKPRAMDLGGDLEGLSRALVLGRALGYFGWCVGYLLAAMMIGMIPALLPFIFCYMRFGAGERLGLSLTVAGLVTGCSYLLFHWLLLVPWPEAWLGAHFPLLRSVRALWLF